MGEYGLYVMIGLIIYFIPAIVADSNKKRNKTAIFVLNLLLGWTLVGWAIALTWACIVDENPSNVDEA